MILCDSYYLLPYPSVAISDSRNRGICLFLALLGLEVLLHRVGGQASGHVPPSMNMTSFVGEMVASVFTERAGNCVNVCKTVIHNSLML